MSHQFSIENLLSEDSQVEVQTTVHVTREQNDRSIDKIDGISSSKSKCSVRRKQRTSFTGF